MNTRDIKRIRTLLVVLAISFLDLGMLSIFNKQFTFSTLSFYCGSLWCVSSRGLWWVAGFMVLVLGHLFNYPLVIELPFIAIIGAASYLLRPLLYESSITVLFFAAFFVFFHSVILGIADVSTFLVICGNVSVIYAILKITIK